MVCQTPATTKDCLEIAVTMKGTTEVAGPGPSVKTDQSSASTEILCQMAIIGSLVTASGRMGFIAAFHTCQGNLDLSFREILA